MDTVKLTMEQYQKLVQKRNRLMEKGTVRELEDVSYQYNHSGFEDIIDYHSVYDCIDTKKELDQIDAILKNCEIIESECNDKVGLGTICSVVSDFGDGELDCSDYILVAENHGTVATKDGATYVTPDSEFGKVIMGKSLMDSFNYTLPNGFEVVGFIEDIEESKQKVR